MKIKRPDSVCRCCKRTHLPQRFIDKIKVNRRGCWIWTGARVGAMAGGQYGAVQWKGYKTVAHRIVWMVLNGAVPEGMKVCHSCDVRLCVNPNHLFLGTQSQNVRDCIAKGRHFPRRGSHNGNAKLTWPKVRRIRKRHTEGETQTALAVEYGVSISTVSGIVRGKKWCED